MACLGVGGMGIHMSVSHTENIHTVFAAFNRNNRLFKLPKVHSTLSMFKQTSYTSPLRYILLYSTICAPKQHTGDQLYQRVIFYCLIILLLFLAHCWVCLFFLGFYFHLIQSNLHIFTDALWFCTNFWILTSFKVKYQYFPWGFNQSNREIIYIFYSLSS